VLLLQQGSLLPSIFLHLDDGVGSDHCYFGFLDLQHFHGFSKLPFLRGFLGISHSLSSLLDGSFNLLVQILDYFIDLVQCCNLLNLLLQQWFMGRLGDWLTN